MAVHSIIHEQENNGGRVPHGLILKVIKNLRAKDIHVTRDILNGRRRRYQASKRVIPTTVVAASHLTTLSELTSCSSNAVSTDVDDEPSQHDRTDVRSRGRPKGTTNKARQEIADAKKRLVNEVAIEYTANLKEKVRKHSKLSNHHLQTLVDAKKKELQIANDVKICLKTIRNRNFTKSITSNHPGTPSPIEELDKLILPIVVQMARIRQPLRPPEVVGLVNSFIQGTVHQKKLIEWKKIHEPHQSAENLGKVGTGYFNRFIKRFGKDLDTTVGRRFAVDRSDWLKPEYLDRMYDAIYKVFTDAGVARHVDVPVAYDFGGALVPIGSPSQYGLPSNIIIDHTDFILFGDETGINTNQMNDGRVGGTKYVVPRGCVPLIQGNTSDHRATVLPFTSASGEPVVCVVIFLSERTHVDPTWHTGIDVTVDPILDSRGNVDVRNLRNYGPDKYFPSGPVCRFRSKVIPTLTFTSPSAAISGEILVKIFTELDQLSLYPRGTTEAGVPLPEPCVVVDGHESRLQPDFLFYINNKEHTWNFALGVPYLTNMWQVGDSPEQNGSFKVKLSQAKEELLAFKIQRGMPPKLTSTDIIPLINIAWRSSFAKVESNRRAVAKRGWYPPTKKILEDPTLFDLQDQAPYKPLTLLDELPESVNIMSGSAAGVIDKLLTHAARKEGTKRRHHALLDGEHRQKNFKDAKKITSGLLIRQGCHSCNDPLLLIAVNEREEKKEQERCKKEKRAKEKIFALKAQVKAACEKRGKDPAKWSSTDCRSFLQYKKMKTDSKMPSSLEPLRRLCEDWKNRPSPNASPMKEFDQKVAV